ncbi:flagellin [uncultured Alsobacter sp.]|uniref:flagellin N-terminal helical domain-containing protein n=1 Tax=uncultured Alsobacter sp. TaxID=1748258 RepID=UPI0025CEC968|nr:flagellin [uncultured Alsobacter sp.]
MPVTLSAGIRTALESIQDAANAATTAQTRLATGKKIATAVDGPLNYYTAAGLTNRASDLAGLQDSMTNAVKTVDAASAGIDGMTRLLQTAQGLASSAAATSDMTSRASLLTQYNTVLKQVDEVMKNSGYNGINLLNGDKLNVKFDASSTTATLGIQNMATGALTANALGVVTAAAGAWTNGTPTAGTDTSGDAAIQTQLTNLTKALNSLRAEASGLGANGAIVKTRQDFTSAMISTLRSGADALTLADVNEEGASLVSLNTRAQLAQTSLSLAAQREQAVLRLF